MFSADADEGIFLEENVGWEEAQRLRSRDDMFCLLERWKNVSFSFPLVLLKLRRRKVARLK